MLVSHCKDNITQLQDQCNDFIQERDTAVEETVRAKEEFSGWRNLKDEMTREIQRRYAIQALTDKIRDEGIDTLYFNADEVEGIGRNMISEKRYD